MPYPRLYPSTAIACYLESADCLESCLAVISFDSPAPAIDRSADFLADPGQTGFANSQRVSPSRRTVKSVLATRSMRSRRAAIAGVDPISGAAPSRRGRTAALAGPRPDWPRPRSTSSTSPPTCAACPITWKSHSPSRIRKMSSGALLARRAFDRALLVLRSDRGPNRWRRWQCVDSLDGRQSTAACSLSKSTVERLLLPDVRWLFGTNSVGAAAISSRK